MSKPSTLIEFKAAIYKELNITFPVFSFLLGFGDLTHQQEIKVEKILRNIL